MKKSTIFGLSMVMLNSVLWAVFGLILFVSSRSHGPNDKFAPIYSFYPVFFLLAFASLMVFTMMLRIARKESGNDPGA